MVFKNLNFKKILKDFKFKLSFIKYLKIWLKKICLIKKKIISSKKSFKTKFKNYLNI